MKNSRQPVIVVMLAALAFAVCHLQGQVIQTQTLNIQLTGFIQNPTVVNGTVETSGYHTVRVTTKDILNYIEAVDANPGDFAGATLIIVNFADILVVKDGNVLDRVARFFSSDSASADFYNETYNPVSGKDNRQSVRIGTFGFDDSAGNNFSFSGLMKETYSASAVDSKGNQVILAGWSLQGAGVGQVGGTATVFNGAISAVGGVRPLKGR